MPLVNLNEVIEFAQKRNCGVGMFNVVNLEFATAVVDAAEEANLPVMIGMPERFFQFYSMQAMAEICTALANRARVPVVVHLDHGKSFETVMKALRFGFTSVMYDGSSLGYENNVKNTSEIVRIAHAMGVSVEGELGYVGRGGIDIFDQSQLTRPEQAYDFATRTNVDALAIAVGNMHGNYKGKPQLDFQRITDIREKVGCGLVLHGGSGLSNEDFVKAIKLGINKVNIYTIMSNYVMNFLNKNLCSYTAWLDLTKDVRLLTKDLVKELIILFGCDNN